MNKKTNETGGHMKGYKIMEVSRDGLTKRFMLRTVTYNRAVRVISELARQFKNKIYSIERVG